jgi:hypothetical protein
LEKETNLVITQLEKERERERERERGKDKSVGYNRRHNDSRSNQ